LKPISFGVCGVQFDLSESVSCGSSIRHRRNFVCELIPLVFVLDKFIEKARHRSDKGSDYGAKHLTKPRLPQRQQQHQQQKKSTKPSKGYGAETRANPTT
jgi:hypothetical protein